METVNTPQKLRRTLIKDKKAYVETVGKNDMPALEEVLKAEDGKGTVVRLFLGATACMPLRALSYVSAAARTAEIIPCEQVQVISVNRLGEQINGIDHRLSGQQSALLALAGRQLVQAFMPAAAEKIIFAEDDNTDHIDRFLPLSESVLAQDAGLAVNLSGKGSKHGSDFALYGAAHLANQDTAELKLSPFFGASTVNPERIVAVGCQQERTFYSLRSQMRSLANTDALLPSAQVFTLHLTPPYYEARNGEQSLEHALENGVDLSLAVDSSSFRDLNHLAKLVRGELDE